MSQNTPTPNLENQLAEWAKGREKASRFAHTERVVETVTQLAEKWSPEDVEVLRLAAWIHDAAKHYSDEDLLHAAENYGVVIHVGERTVPMLLHGIIGYYEAAHEFGINDERIRTACAYHTTGDPTMSLPDKLLFLADLIEPERDFPLVDELRILAQVDINKTMLLAVDGTIRHLLERRRFIDPRVVDLYNVLIQDD